MRHETLKSHNPTSTIPRNPFRTSRAPVLQFSTFWPNYAEPIYVNNNNRFSPPREDFTAPLGRQGFSNDARFNGGRSVDSRASDDKSIDGRSVNLPDAPFKGNTDSITNCNPKFFIADKLTFSDNACANVTPTSSTYFYNQSFNKIDHSRQSLYILGSSVESFVSHELKDAVSKFGEVDWITFLYATAATGRRINGAAFVAFQVWAQCILLQSDNPEYWLTSTPGRRQSAKGYWWTARAYVEWWQHAQSQSGNS